MSGRRPLGRDDALDYDVMSDEDWESEPEGEDLDVVRDCPCLFLSELLCLLNDKVPCEQLCTLLHAALQRCPDLCSPSAKYAVRTSNLHHTSLLGPALSQQLGIV